MAHSPVNRLLWNLISRVPDIDMKPAVTITNTVDPQIHELARRLLAHETAASGASEKAAPALVRVSEKLRRLLADLIGTLGFRTLLHRALTLAKKHEPQLNPLQVKPDGSLEGYGGLLGQDQTPGADAVLIAQLLDLFATFIGKDLVLTLMQGAWPDLPVSDEELWRKNDHDAPK